MSNNNWCLIVEMCSVLGYYIYIVEIIMNMTGGEHVNVRSKQNKCLLI